MGMFARRLAIGWAAGGLLSSIAAADIHVEQTPQAFDSEFLAKAGHLDAGSVRFYPYLQAGYAYDDNIFESNEHVTSSPVVTLVPEISALWQRHTGAAQLGYRAAAVQYLDSSDDNFTGQLLFGRGRLEAGYRNRFSLDLAYQEDNEPRGTGITVGVDPTSVDMPDSPDEFTDQRGALGYEYGARGAQGMLRLYTNGLDHQFTNHRDRTIYFDRDEVQVGGAFLWRVFPNSSAVFELRSKSIGYGRDRPGETALDSTEQNILIGAEWDLTETTKGSLRVGQNQKDFDAGDREDDDNTAWEVSANWTPKNYSRFNVRFERMPQETTGIGDFIDTRTAEVTWEQQWLQRLSTKLRLKNMDEDYRNAGDRSQKTDEVQFDLNYTMFNWLTWTLTAVVRDRSSDTPSLEFDRNVYRIGAELRL